VLLPFGQFQTIVALTAWLAPVFLLGFSRTQRALIALPVLTLVHYLATLVSMRGGLIPGNCLEDEAALIRRAEALAREENIYLQLGVVVELPTEHYPFAENRAILIDPSGEVVQNYFKAIHPLDDANVFAPGPGVMPTTDTPYGRIATIICFDADFPALVRQAGRTRVDILLVPSNDWQPVDTIHARAATFRAVENGVALVRPTGNGISVAVDHLGQILGMADYFATPALTIVADVPTRGVATIYPRIGDAVAYLCVALLVALGAAAFIASRRKNRGL
jgi:apolipoprotein N-acyltransferase